MEPSLFNFNTISLVLSAPPPLSTRTMYLSSYIQGVTKAQLNYNQLFFVNSTTLSGIKPFKIKLEWDQSLGGESTVIINDVYKFDINTDPLSTFSPLNSALSYYVYTPTQIQPQQLNSKYTVYYENGVIHTYQNKVFLISDNVIDMNLNVTELQNAYQKGLNVFNISSEKGNMMFNVTNYGDV